MDNKKAKSCKFCCVDFLSADVLRIHESHCQCSKCKEFDLDAKGFCKAEKCVKENEKRLE